MVFHRGLFAAVVILLPALSLADDPVFSGPQPGEALTSFRVVSVYGEQAGSEVDPIDMAQGKPMMLVFVHKLTRPGIALTRGLTAFAKQIGAASGIVWLDDDKADAEDYLTRAKTSLNLSVPVGVSTDGAEGPGAYGLNRNVELTILIAKENKVTANFALVQPSVTEGPAIAGELAKLVSQPTPSESQFEKLAYPGQGMMRRKAGMKRRPAGESRNSDLRTMMSRVIDEDITASELRDAVKAIDVWTGNDAAKQAQVGRMSAAVLERGLGSAEARAAIKDWRERYSKD